MSSPQTPTFALLSGGGTLPAALLAGAMQKGWPCHLVTFTGQPQPENLPESLLSHKEFSLGAIGGILKHLARLGVTHVALAGHLSKPSLFTLRPDGQGLKLMARLLAEKSFHDDALLRAATALLAEQGLTILAVADLAPGLLAPRPTKGNLLALGKVQPTVEDKADLALALLALEPLGRLDIGQGVVVHHRTVIGVEAVEGTDALLARCAGLLGSAPGAKASGKGQGLLVKVAKPGQTDLADLPTIGPATLKNLKQHGYRGVIVQAEKTLLLAQPQLIDAANRDGLLLATTTVPWDTR